VVVVVVVVCLTTAHTRTHHQDVDKNGVVDYVEWLESVQPNDATLHPFFCANGGSGGESTLLPKLNPREAQQMDNMVDRLERLAERAAAQRVHLMVDAEQTYFQPAIDHMVLNLQKKFNRDFPAIYNTYQCYLTNTAGACALCALCALISC
jgi:proline dehydrogenase